MKWIEQIKKDRNNHNQILSFDEYMKIVEENPLRELRPSFQYLLDMLNHFKRTPEGHFELFAHNDDGSVAVHGQHYAIDSIYQNLKNFSEEGYNNKFILLVGPNGSAKSSLVKKIMKGAESYSEKPEGRLFSFSWIFPADNLIKGTLGFEVEGNTRKKSSTSSYAHLEDKHISAIIPSELKDHPILLIPLKYRQELIEQLFHHAPELFAGVKKSYLYQGDLSKRNRMIYDALLSSYKGDHLEVLKHIRVEQFTLSTRYSVGAVTIEPQLHVDAQMQQITMDKRLASLPPSLQSLNLFSMQGEAIMANRGILEYSDLLKRPLDTFKYLMMTAETGNINLHGILTELDIFFIGTSNEIHLAAFKQHPDFNSFKGRFNFIKVPYLLNYRYESKIYDEQVDGLKDRTIFEPHAIDTLTMFAVMTRVRPCDKSQYEDAQLGELAHQLTPLDKLLLFSDKKAPAHLDSESTQILLQGRERIFQEFFFDEVYEGKFGISPRDVKQIIYKLAEKQKTVTFIDVLEYLEKKLLPKKSSYDFLNIPPHGDFHNPRRFLDILRKYFLDIFDNELRGSLGLIDDRSYEEYIYRYVTNINANLKGEKIKNKITGKYEQGDSYFMTEFETAIKLSESADIFRSHLIAKLGAYSLDNPKKKLIYTEVFPELVTKLKESFRQEQEKVIYMISKNLIYFESEELGETTKGAQLDPQDREKILTVLTNLQKVYGYSETGARILTKLILKERY